MAGEVPIAWQEPRWEFTPDRAWEPGDYFIRMHPALEEFAGNNLAHRFDEQRQPQGPLAAVSIPLHIPAS